MFGRLVYTKINIFLYQNHVKLCFNMLISKVISKKILTQQALFSSLDLLCHGTFNSGNNYQYQYSPAHSSDN